MRDIEIGAINRNTLAERSVRYRERWRYDEAAKTWWLVSGLPDLWATEPASAPPGVVAYNRGPRIHRPSP